MDKETLRRAWKELTASDQPTAGLHVQYCLLKALTAQTNEQDKLALAMIYQAFTPITNLTKLQNGQQPYQAVRDALTWVSVFGNKSPLYKLLDAEFESNYLHVLLRVIKGAVHLEQMRVKDHMYLYLYVRNDLSPEQIIIQTAHLTYEAGFLLARMGLDRCPRFIVFGVTSAKAMEEKYDALPPSRILGYFREERMDMITGLVLKPMLASTARQKKYFINDQLMTAINPERSLVREVEVVVVETFSENEAIRDEC